MYFIIGSLFLFICILFSYTIYLHLSFRKIQTESNKIKKVQDHYVQEFKALLNADIVFGKSLSLLKEQLNAIDDRQAYIENRRSNDGGYQHALKLLALGSSVDEIIESCSLSPAEAELIANLEAYRSIKKPEIM